MFVFASLSGSQACVRERNKGSVLVLVFVVQVFFTRYVLGFNELSLSTFIQLVYIIIITLVCMASPQVREVVFSGLTP